MSSFALKFRTLKRVDVYLKFDSSEYLLKISECCRELETLIILRRSDIEAIASLPCLKELEINNIELSQEMISPLSRCKKLKNLSLVVDFYILLEI
jgi:hypothetical protein